MPALCLRVGRRLLAAIQHAAADAVGVVQIAAGRPLSSAGCARIALKQWRSQLADAPGPRDSQLVIAIVAFRNRRWVEWAAFSAAYLYRLGYPIQLVYSGAEITSIYGRRKVLGRLAIGFWDALCALPYFTFVDLDQYLDAEAEGSYSELSEQWAHTIAAYDLKCEEHEPADAAAYERAGTQARLMLQRMGPAVERYLRHSRVSRVICPSGIIGWSVAVREAARRTGVPVVFVESWRVRTGHNIWNVNRPALDFDVDGWIEAIGPWTHWHECEYEKLRRFREGQPAGGDPWLRNLHQVQGVQKSSALPPEVAAFLGRPGPTYLLGTNVVGDSATLRRATIFRSQQEWLAEILRFFRGRPELKLIVRAHPDEVWQNSRIRMGDIARRLACGALNILVVDSHARVNTFALIERSHAGLVWVSNLGLDMAIRGRPVLLAAQAPYAHLGVCQTASSVREYFERLPTLAGQARPPDDAILRAKTYQFALFRLMSLHADSDAYSGADYRLTEQPEPEQDMFYRILAGELPDKYPALLARPSGDS